MFCPVKLHMPLDMLGRKVQEPEMQIEPREFEDIELHRSDDLFGAGNRVAPKWEYRRQSTNKQKKVERRIDS
jgi:hypothetical protein